MDFVSACGTTTMIFPHWLNEHETLRLSPPFGFCDDHTEMVIQEAKSCDDLSHHWKHEKSIKLLIY